MSGKYSETTEGIDVAYVAYLARLKLDEDEVERFQCQLDQILDYVKQLSELDVEGVEPMAHGVPVQNVFRKDEPGESLDRDTALANAPAEKLNQFLAPKIVE